MGCKNCALPDSVDDALSAGGRTSAPSLPVRPGTVHWAVGQARTSCTFDCVPITWSTAIFCGHNHCTIPSGQALSTGSTALPLTPHAPHAVHWAISFVAGLDGIHLTNACRSAMLCIGALPRASHVSETAAHRTGRPLCPLLPYTGRWTVCLSTAPRLSQVPGTLPAAVDHRRFDLPHAQARAISAGHGASTPVLPVIPYAVHRAGEQAARFSLRNFVTPLAGAPTVLGMPCNVS
mmetsp:Transcript_81302/g.143425  ORF Transcript_81302/g.143425 Transcript_81302/m.143425 type:complete len:235 (-) Transcript_81302:1175-1879(-)